jgi:hypothetical protein
MPGTVTVPLPLDTSVAPMTTLNCACRVADLPRSLERSAG